MPYSVEHLIANQGNVVVVRITGMVSEALDLMIENDFSQLPVVAENGSLAGMVTYESIMRAARSFNLKPDQLLVRDAMVDAPCHYREDDLFDLLDELKLSHAVVIIEPGGYATGIVTSYDASRFLRNRTEDLMHVEDIEFIIKELIRRTYVGNTDALGADQPHAALQPSSAKSGRPSSSKHVKPFEELNLGDYINLLMSKRIWRLCAPILKVEKESLYELLVKIRQTRNDLAHFRSEISPRNRDELRYCANWLRSRYQAYERAQAGDLINILLEQHEQRESTHAAQEEPVSYLANPVSSTEPKEGKITSRSRYAALANWLAGQKEDQILLTFEQIETIIRSPLPDSARQLRAWWANDRGGHMHSILWLEAGWKVVYVDLDERQVVFARPEPGNGK